MFNIFKRGLPSSSARVARFHTVTSGANIPDKSKKNGGEDALFVLPQDFGVFDGVGGWSQSGIDAGVYSRHLSKSIEQYISHERSQNVPKIDLAKALDYAEICCKEEKLTGSCTACVTSFDINSGSYNVLNLGDSGVAIFRKVGDKRKMIYKSEFTLHGFNFPHQIGNIGDPKLGEMKSDTSKDAILQTIQVEDGDIAVMATDGLWDNVFDSEIESILSGDDIAQVDRIAEKNSIATEETHNEAKKHLDDVVREIALLSIQKAANPKSKTPWSVSVVEHYKEPKYTGGKPDDLTFLVTYFKKDIEGSE